MRWKVFFLGIAGLGCQIVLAGTGPSRPDIDEMQKALSREQKAILELQTASEKQNETLKGLQQALAIQLRAAARLSHASNKARLLGYHGYLGRSRAALIADIQTAQTARDRLLRKRQLHEVMLKKLLLAEMQKTPPPPSTLIQTSPGTPIYSVADGKVIFADALRGFGLMVIISHPNDYMSLYGRNHTLFAKIGDNVHKGQLIAMAGNREAKGIPQRYFELRHKGSPLPPGQNTFILNNESAHSAQ